MTGLASVHSYA